nr:hypothetical protein BaRGS_015872 [Batillaria attramentaria]
MSTPITGKTKTTVAERLSPMSAGSGREDSASVQALERGDRLQLWRAEERESRLKEQLQCGELQLKVERHQEELRRENERHQEERRRENERQQEEIWRQREELRLKEDRQREELGLQEEETRLKLERNGSPVPSPAVGTLNLKLPAFDEENEDLDTFLGRFERVARLQKWPEDTWGARIGGQLVGRAAQVYLELTDEQVADFEQVRASLREAFQLNGEYYRRQLRSTRKQEKETFPQFVTRLGRLLGKWISLSGKERTFEGLWDLVLQEQLLQTVSFELETFLRQQDIVDVKDAASRAEKFVEARRSTRSGSSRWKSDRSNRSTTKGSTEKSSPLKILKEAWTQDSDEEVKTTVQYVLDLRERLEAMSERARKNLGRSAERCATAFSRKAKPCHFPVGSRVLLLLPTRRNKLEMAWQGPYEVVERAGEADYRIRVGDRIKLFHANLLKAYQERDRVQDLPPPAPRVRAHVALVVDESLEEDAPGRSDELPVPVLAPEEGPTDLSLNPELPPEQRERILRAPIVFVKKKDGKVRFCIDYRQLNRVTVFDAEPLPDIEYLFSRPHDAKFFTKIDLAKGYWQIPVREEDRPKLAFTTPLGQFQWRVMPFGLQNAVAIFSRMMRKLLEPLKRDDVVNFMDDILIATKNFEIHLEVLDIVFRRLEEEGLTARPSKCFLGFPELEYLGHRIGNGCMGPSPGKLEQLKEARRPTTKRETRAFLGLASF